MYDINCFNDSLQHAEAALNNAPRMGREYAVRSALTYLMFAALSLGDIEDWQEHHAGHQLLMELYDRVREEEKQL